LLANATTRLSVVIAPAGCGKTTLLSQWANDSQERRPIAWVSLDERDDEPVRFWAYVFSAAHAVTPEVGAEALAVMTAAGSDVLDAALATFLNELAASAAQRVLILDDYHVLTDARIHESVEFFLAYAAPALHLVVAGRSDPPLPLARLRARGELTEIRADDLRFGADEARLLFDAIGGFTPDERATTDLVDRTEGWVTGLQLAALTLRSAADPGAAAAAMRGDDRHILDYFATEVLPALDAEQRDLLVRTSVLDTINGSLCDAVLGRSDSRAVLASLDRADLFVVPLDPQHEWYRCHRLFRDVLRWDLEATDPTAIPTLLRRSAEWFRANGDNEEAIRLLLAAGDEDNAMTVLAASFGWFVEAGRSGTFLRLGERAAAVAARRPHLCLLLGWAAGAIGHLDEVDRWLDAADAFVAAGVGPMPDWSTLEGQVAAMRATFGTSSDADSDRTLVFARRATDLEADPDTQGYVVARVALAGALMVGDDYEQAADILADVWARPGRRRLPDFVMLQVAGLYAASLLRAGDVADAARVCAEVAPAARAAEETRGDGAAASLTLLRLAEGRLAYRDGEIELARQLLRRASMLAAIWGRPTNLASALTSLAEAELAAGDREAARRAIDEAREVAAADPVARAVARDLEHVAARISRGAADSARRFGALAGDLTDRELSVLRNLQGSASQREIASELFLSLNTVKGYTRSLYRKLDVGTRQDAVARGRELGLI
jgi:LuxR family maltose regulon positive regulatory protein